MYQQRKQSNTGNFKNFRSDLPVDQYRLVGNRAALAEVMPHPSVIQRLTDTTLHEDYDVLQNFMHNPDQVTLADLATAVIHIDPRMAGQPGNAITITTRASELFHQALQAGDKLNNIHADQNVLFTNANDEITPMYDATGQRQVLITKLENNVKLFTSLLLPNIQPVLNAVIESMYQLAPAEQQYLQNTNTEIYIHSITPGSNIQQQGTWTFDETTNTHRGDIFINGNMVSMSVPGTVGKSQGAIAAQKAIIKHELGHILHAILHSSDFRLATLVDESQVSLNTDKPIGTILNNMPVGQDFSQWNYAATHNSIREFVTEIFVALTSGLPISQQQYDWYVAHGGPEITGHATTVNSANHFQVIRK